MSTTSTRRGNEKEKGRRKTTTKEKILGKDLGHNEGQGKVGQKGKFDNKKRKSNGKNKNKEPPTCYLSNKKGHYASSCW